jgi:hypothetical protein
MAYYYTKTGGTATGDGGRATTQRTGAWNSTASEYYDSVVDARGATTQPGDGDFILISDLHNNTDSTTIILNGGGVDGGAGLFLVSVDDANQENYKPGATERINSGNGSQLDLGFSGMMAGINYETTIDATSLLRANSATTNLWKFIDCNLTCSSTSTAILNTQKARSNFVFINCDMTPQTECFGLVQDGASIYWYGGKLIGNHPINSGTGLDGGAFIYLEGVDLSDVAGVLIDEMLTTDSLGNTDITLVRCQMNFLVTLPSDTDFPFTKTKFKMLSCDDSFGGGDLFRFIYQTGLGQARNNESVFVTANTAWGETSDKSSIEITTVAECNSREPFIVELPIAQQYIDLASTSSDILRLPITTTLTLTDTEIVAYLMYPDGTTSIQPNWVTSGATVGTGNYGTDPLGAGSTLPTSTTTWTGAKTNKYHLELDTTGDPGQFQAVGVRLEVYRPSIAVNTLMIATEFEVL